MKIDWQRTAAVGICIALLFAALLLFGKYIMAAFMPFFTAWIIAWIANSISSFIRQKIKIRRKPCVITVLAILFFAIGGILIWSVESFITEAEKFIERLTADNAALSYEVAKIANRFNDIGSHIPLIGELKNNEQLALIGNQLNEIIKSFFKSLATNLGSALTSWAAKAVRALPSAIVFLVISVVSSFYFALDFDTINRNFVSFLPQAVKKRLPILKKQTRSLAIRYVKAYSFLLMLTFFELFIGLSIIGIDYVFLSAMLISFIDILPIFGVGTILIPWSLISFFTHNFERGIGLIILWASVTVIRQIIEPKIVGNTIGLPPVVTLIGIYAGFKLFGIIGMFSAPAVILAARSYLIQKNQSDNAKKSIDSDKKK